MRGLRARRGHRRRRGDRKPGDIPGGEDIVEAPDAAVLVDDDAIGDGKPSGLGEVCCGRDPKAGNDSPGVEGQTTLEHDPRGTVGLDRRHRFAGEYVDSLRAVVVGHERGQLGWEAARAKPLLREDERNVVPVHGQGRADLRTNESTADDDEAGARNCQFPDATVVVDRPEVDDPIVGERHAPRGATCSQKHPLVGADFAGVVGRSAAGVVERHDPSAELQIDAERPTSPSLDVGTRSPPDAAEAQVLSLGPPRFPLSAR